MAERQLLLDWQQFRATGPLVVKTSYRDQPPWVGYIGGPLGWSYFPTWREAYDWVCSELLKAKEARPTQRAGLRSVR